MATAAVITADSACGRRRRDERPCLAPSWSTTASAEAVRFDAVDCLGLQRHPRVLEARRQAEDASQEEAALWRGRLEERIRVLHGRETVVLVPNGRSAVAAAVATLGRDALVAWDAAASDGIQKGVRQSHGGPRLPFDHMDLAHLDRLLERDAAQATRRVVVSDGMFGADGHLAPLPGLIKLAQRHGAALVVDDTHALGVLGDTGRGSEEHFALPGAIDVLAGGFAEATGLDVGFVAGARERVDALRSAAECAAFAPEPSICAALIAALDVMEREPAHRARLWSNARRLWLQLEEAGLLVPPRPSPILPVFVGEAQLAQSLTGQLRACGVCCGARLAPCSRRGEWMLRLVASALHSEVEIDRAAGEICGLTRRLAVPRRTIRGLSGSRTLRATA